MWQRITKWWKSRDKNNYVQEICSIIIGIGLGLYGYESKLALLPMKWTLHSKVEHLQQSQSPRISSEPILAQQVPDLFAPVKKWQQDTEEHFRKFRHHYEKSMENLGIRGGLKQRMDELLQQGAEPIPSRWTTQENRPFLIVSIAVILAAAVLKILLYTSRINLNSFNSPATNAPIRAPARGPAKAVARTTKRRRHTDWNGIVQDICTITLSTLFGMYVQPALEEFLKGEAPSYPYPLSGFMLILGLIAIKAALAGSLLDINAWKAKTGPLLSWHRFSNFSRVYNWNDLAHEMTGLILGIGLGFYAYESNLALLPMKWQTDRKVAKEIHQESRPRQERPTGFNPFQTLFQNTPLVQDFWKKSGIERYADNLDKYTKVLEHYGVRGHFKDKMDNFMRTGVQAVPQKWTQPGNAPYFLAGLAVVLASLALKLALYLRLLDINRIVKRKLGPKIKKPVAWSEMIHGLVTVILSAMAGMYSNSLMDYLAGEEAISYPYPRLGPCLIAACLLVKFLLYTGIIRFREKPKMAMPKSVAHKPGYRRK